MHLFKQNMFQESNISNIKDYKCCAHVEHPIQLNFKAQSHSIQSIFSPRKPKSHVTIFAITINLARNYLNEIKDKPPSSQHLTTNPLKIMVIMIANAILSNKSTPWATTQSPLVGRCSFIAHLKDFKSKIKNMTKENGKKRQQCINSIQHYLNL